MSLMSHTMGAQGCASKVFIASPSYTGKFDSLFLHAMVKSLPLLEENGIGYELFTLSHHCHVDDSRNKIVAEFLESDCESLIFIDSDVSWKDEDLLKLAKYDRDVVAGVYPKRSDKDKSFPVHVEAGKALYADKDGLVEVLGAPTGFMKIKRHVIEKMRDLNKDRTFKSSKNSPLEPVQTIIFERTLEDGIRRSGDVNFCHQWRKMGGKVFVDPEMSLCHMGEIEFHGTLGDYWREIHGVGDFLRKRNFKAAIETLRNGKCTGKEIEALQKGWGNGDFAATSELLASCYWLAKGKTGHILETGSGLSSIVMALANPDLTIHCLEHDIMWASKLKYECQVHGINNIIIYQKDLKKYEKGNWYDVSDLPDHSYSIALCDGPPRRISERSIFYEKLDEKIKDAVVIMDDADNDKALEPIRDWATSNGRKVTVLGTDRKFAISESKGTV